MNIKARIKKLQTAMGVGKPCARCRLNLRSVPAAPGRQKDSVKVVRRSCHICGAEHGVPSNIEGRNEFERQIRHEITLVRQPEDLYTDKRISAIYYWFSLQKSEDDTKLASVHPTSPRRGEPPSKAAKLHAELTAQAEQDQNQWRARMLAKHGNKFPEHNAILDKMDETLRSYHSSTWEKELARLQAMSQFEQIISGSVAPETQAEINRIKREQQEREEAARREAEEQRQKEEAARQEAEERAAEEARRLAAEEAELIACREAEEEGRRLLAIFDGSARLSSSSSQRKWSESKNTTRAWGSGRSTFRLGG
jgi:hypothetical protein